MAQPPQENPFAAPPTANPFAAPAQQAPSVSAASMNPFDPMGAAQTDPFASAPPPTAAAQQTTAPVVAPGAHHPPTGPPPFVPQHQMSFPPQPMLQGQPQVSQQPFPTSMNPPPSNALVPQQQSFPHDGIVPQQAAPPFQTSATQPPHQPQAVASFDPFAPPPPRAPAPPPETTAMVPAAPSQTYPGAMQPQPDLPQYNQIVPAPSADYMGLTEYQQPVQPPPGAPPVNEVSAVAGGWQSVISEPEVSLRSPYGASQMVPYSEQTSEMVAFSEQEKPSVEQNKYSQALAREAPPGSAPLPKGDMVAKSGYVLSRISFRTILIKKWKQSFWVQYGRHTMLWFRSEKDFDEWLNNPYLTQTQRNFLIKLAVNFVHDLYKPNVRGYQVTQARTKAYGKKMLRQFKLERWMDYGPTIAAAFASPDPQEVDTLREAIIECMKNTPLEGGIRATGAVRQDHPGGAQDEHEEQQYGYSGQPYQNYQLDTNGQHYGDQPYNDTSQFGNSQRQQSGLSGGATTTDVSVDSTPDLLGGFDDNTSSGGQPYVHPPAAQQQYIQHPPPQPQPQPFTYSQQQAPLSQQQSVQPPAPQQQYVAPAQPQHYTQPFPQQYP